MRCKKGDLAIVLRGGFAGYIVDVLDFVGKSHDFKSGEARNNAWAIRVRGETHSPVYGKRFGATDEDLLPIRPGDLKETETEKEKEIERV